MTLKNNNLKNKLKYKIINHLMKRGNKHTCEKLLRKSLKLLQKSQSKPHSDIIKSAILNATPVFRIIELASKQPFFH